MVSTTNVGRVFTPLNWAEWLIDESGAFSAWLKGATVLDPTAGQGVFLDAFVSLARRRKGEVHAADVARLHAIEMIDSDKKIFLDRFLQKHGNPFPKENFLTSDFITAEPSRRFDVLVGNPPWANFTDLTETQRKAWGPHYLANGLVRSKKNVLLGSSRADIATLVIKKAMDQWLSGSGIAAFFLPLSLFFNSGSNDLFRPYPGSVHTYRVTSLWDFAGEDIFGGVSTRYGAAFFEKGKGQAWPVRVFIRRPAEGWEESYATSSDRQAGSWLRHESTNLQQAITRPEIPVQLEQRPRQGVNTCGASRLFIFEKEDGVYINGFQERLQLEDALMFPLMQANLFQQDVPRSREQKWILMPHNPSSGAAFEVSALARYPKAYAYLKRHRETLSVRKGAFIRSQIDRGRWWALLGVGRYSFSPWKVAWESLGKKVFRPVVLGMRWQGNQALHAFCPCPSKEAAELLCAALRQEDVERWLKSSTMGGTCNWAQPGRVAQLLTVTDRQSDLFVAA